MESIISPKSFHPVGTSNKFKFNLVATRSTAQHQKLAEIYLATDVNPPCQEKNGMISAWAAMIAKEGITWCDKILSS